MPGWARLACSRDLGFGFRFGPVGAAFFIPALQPGRGASGSERADKEQASNHGRANAAMIAFFDVIDRLGLLTVRASLDGIGEYPDRAGLQPVLEAAADDRVLVRHERLDRLAGYELGIVLVHLAGRRVVHA